ncbi:hypothetical protein D030_4426A, partial [Vibrio parahaemolyticus AQ3810]
MCDDVRRNVFCIK